jgi:glucosamine--fructose-6-phosphate aminotransferase (isomerizing)
MVIRVGAGPEIAVVTTKAFSAQLATLYLVSQAAQNNLTNGKTKIKKLANLINSWLNPGLEKKVLNLAKNLIDQEHVFLIGKNLNYPAALECALKIKEASYLHAEAFAAGELKHGVISLIQQGTPCIVLAAGDSVKSEILSSATEVKSRGGKIIGIAPFAAPEFAEVINTPDLGELTLFGNIIVGQLLGYYLGIGRGADPDKPRNLAKSVTVK